MAWNGSENAANSSRTQKAAPRRTSPLRGLLAGLIVVIGVGVFLYLTRSSGELKEEPASGAKKGRIAEVTPAAVTNVPAAKPAPKPAPKKIDPNARPTKVGEEVNGYVLLPSGRMHHRTGVITNSIAMRPKGKWEIFDRACNNEIAAYLTIQPGGLVIGPMKYDGWFKKDFIESIKEPILITDKDTPEEKELKEAVIAARLELKDALDRGEDIEQIMRDTRADLQRMMEVKMEMRNLFFEEKQNCETDQDLDDLFNACNKILEDKGIAPIKYGPITRRNLEWQKNHENN